MITASTALTHEGTATLNIGSAAEELRGDDLNQLRSTVMKRVRHEAKSNSIPVQLETHDPDGSRWVLIVHPDGRIEDHTHAAQEESAMPTPSHAPRPEEAPTIPEAPKEAPTVPEQPSEPPFAWADHPDWKQVAHAPAATGWRAVLKLPPSRQELAARQEAFSREMEEREERYRQEEQRRQQVEERRAAEARQQAEDISRRQALDEQRRAHVAKLNRVIQTNYQGTRTILIANPKGGARKTTTSYILGAMIGSTRGGSTIAWDANETMGTLGERAIADRHNRTVVDLLQDGAQHFLDIDSARVGILDAYVRNQGDCHFDVLASDENPQRQDQINDEGFRKVHDILSHFYRMILVDTGNNIRADHFTEAQKHADQLVIPVAASHDSKNRALDMMAAFTASGHDHLVANAVVLVHELEPISRAEDGTPLDNSDHEMTANEIAEAFDGRVRAVLPVPYDPELKDGGKINFFELSAETIRAYREAAAALSNALIDSTLSSGGRHAAPEGSEDAE